MRIAVALAMSALAAACDSGGMEIIVYAPSDPGTPQPASVRLYIGLGAGEMTTIAPAPGTGPRFSAPRWDRDPGNTDDVAPIENGVAQFVFRPSGNGVDKLGVVIAVGYDARGVPTSSDVLVGPEMGHAHVTVYRMGLNAISNPITNDNGYNSLALWGPHSANGVFDDACAFAQHPYPSPSAGPAFITTPGDEDCDGVPDTPTPPECDASTWNSTRVSDDIRDTTCILRDPLGSAGAAFCVLGGPRCTDGVGPDGSCAPANYCAHPFVCDACLGRPGDPYACAADVPKVISAAASVPAIHCEIPRVQPTPGDNPGPCTTDNTIPIASLVLPADIRCTGVHVRNAMQTWSSKLADPADPGVTFAVSIDKDTCVLTVTGGGTYASANTTTQTVSGLLAVDLGNNRRGIAVPIEIELGAFTGQCAPSSCHLVNDSTDQLAACVDSGRDP